MFTFKQLTTSHKIAKQLNKQFNKILTELQLHYNHFIGNEFNQQHVELNDHIDAYLSNNHIIVRVLTENNVDNLPMHTKAHKSGFELTFKIDLTNQGRLFTLIDKQFVVNNPTLQLRKPLTFELINAYTGSPFFEKAYQCIKSLNNRDHHDIASKSTNITIERILNQDSFLMKTI